MNEWKRFKGAELENERERYFMDAIVILNKKNLQGGRVVFNAGSLGYALVYWRRSWKVEWFDETMTI